MRLISFLATLPIFGLAALIVLAAPAQGAPGDIGYQDQSFSGTGTPTGIKRAESLLWWNDGSWWANMWDTASQDFHIFRLDVSSQTWQDTGVTIDSRANTHADVLWDGARLYVASHEFVGDGQSAASGSPSYLFRFSYNTATKSYARDSGFPVQINNMKTETLAIDKDSTGKLWATWQENDQIYLNRTLDGDDRLWGTPYAFPNSAGNVTVDDNSALVRFGGNKIGLMWSNQTGTNAGMWFAVHQDGASDTAWGAGERVLQGASLADDHMNLKSDGQGRVFAATKTSNTSSSTPLVMLSVRTAAGAWTSYTVAQVSDCPNRAIVVVDEQNGVLHMFYTAPAPPNYNCTSSGGAIYEKTSAIGSISFPSGRGTPVIVDADSAFVHDVTASKQNVNGSSELAVLAANNSTKNYWHHYEALPGSSTPTPSPSPTPTGAPSPTPSPTSSPPPTPSPTPPPQPPVADFNGSPTSGIAPLTVQFTDTSTGGAPTSWVWNFGDGGTSSAQNPSHVYGAAGIYSVTLQATNASGSNTLTKTNYISVQPPPPDFSVSASPLKRTIQRGGSTTYAITVTPSNGFTGPVALSVSGQPLLTFTSFSPNPVDGSAPASSTLSVATTLLTRHGGYTLTITASGGGITHTTTVTLLIKK